MINRDIHLKRLIAAKHNGMIKIVTGIRRCGKSTLLFKLFTDHLKQCKVERQHIIEVDLENRRNKALRNPDALITHIDSMIKDQEMHYVLIDEVQHVNEFADVLNSYLKMDNVDIYVTGSNSRFLSTDVATEFRGRGMEIRISPLSFREFRSEFSGSKEDALREYLTYGGLPKLIDLPSEEDKAQYLTDLFETTYLRDIKERYGIKNEDEFGELLNILASSIGSLTNPRKLENSFRSVKKMSLSFKTIKSYIEIMEEAFILEKSIRYDIKGKSYIDTPFKCYFTDLGLRNARIHFRQQEVTHLMENLIYNELRLRGYSVDVGMVLHNTKDKEGQSQRKQLEVDFVCNQGSKRIYIQSAFRLATAEKREQELRSLRLIDDSFRKYVITEDPIKKHQNEDGIVFMNLYDFLLDEDALN